MRSLAKCADGQATLTRHMKTALTQLIHCVRHQWAGFLARATRGCDSCVWPVALLKLPLRRVMRCGGYGDRKTVQCSPLSRWFD